jgi:uridylate kinase
MKKIYVISLGGSLIAPDKIDPKFLKEFSGLIRKRIAKGSRFVLVTGGGKICRDYQDTLKNLAAPSASDLDWMGIAFTHANATLVQLLFGKLAHPAIITNPTKKVAFREKILMAGGWKPGWSTDFITVKLAAVYGAQTVINLSNIDYVYDKDPRKHRNAKKIRQVSWPDFQKIVGTKWKPGANAPFDPIASKFARAHKQTVIIANGRNMKNLDAILSGSQKFIGTKVIGA